MEDGIKEEAIKEYKTYYDDYGNIIGTVAELKEKDSNGYTQYYLMPLTVRTYGE